MSDQDDYVRRVTHGVPTGGLFESAHNYDEATALAASLKVRQQAQERLQRLVARHPTEAELAEATFACGLSSQQARTLRRQRLGGYHVRGNYGVDPGHTPPVSVFIDEVADATPEEWQRLMRIREVRAGTELPYAQPDLEALRRAEEK